MKVAFDATTAAFSQKTGTGVYCEELIRAYQNRFEEDDVFHAYRLSRRWRGRNFLLPLTPRAHRVTLLDPLSYFYGYRFDLFHGLNSRLPLLPHCKMVATIHDLFSIFGRFSEERFRKEQTKNLLQMIARAHHIIVPANYTKGLLTHQLGVADQKISVVGEGVRDIFLSPRDPEASAAHVAKTFRITRPYFLFVGTLEKRKNIAGLVRSYAKFKASFKGEAPDLVLIGHEGFGFEEINVEIENSGCRESIQRLGFVNQDDLADLYRACQAFVYLSLEEGFGIPIIEAMACGVPVISSNTTSLPEAGGGFSFLVSPDDDTAIVNAFAQMSSLTPSLKDHIQKAQKYAQTLTWTWVAEETRKVYTQVFRQ